MRFIQEFGFTVRQGQREAFQRWLIEHEEELARSYPEGTRHLGTFATVYSSEKHAGEFRVFIELDSYGAQDRLAAAAKDPESEHGRLLRGGDRVRRR